MTRNETVSIIGAGLAGSLLAIYLAKRGIEVEVFESRADMRVAGAAGGRSINLALSDRGIAALREVGMDSYILAEAVPMYGRMIHSEVGETKLLPYSGRSGEYINSVSRTGLNVALINKAESLPNVKLHFGRACTGFDVATSTAHFADGSAASGNTLIATDGAGSAIRRALHRSGAAATEITESWLDHGYKELHIPPQTGADPFAIEKGALHIWPRHKFMMIALPNFDGSFTCTLFLAHRDTSGDPGLFVENRNAIGGSSEASFDQLIDDAAIRRFFEREFPDAVPLMPTLLEDFKANPIGDLGTLRCSPWNAGRHALLLGDSAHAMVPFYGQGMNCAFEDVRVLNTMIDQYGTDWNTVFAEFARARKPNADAIQDMAEENFFEMRDATADPIFHRKRELETRLEQTYPEYFSKYSMVTFREDLPYIVAKRRGNAQDELLMKICSEVTEVGSIDLGQVMDKIAALPE